MIGWLSGNLKCCDNLIIIVDVKGIGYEINVLKIPCNIGERTDLFIHTHVREDQITLYGFESRNALSLFKTLISVKGIGPKVAQNILATLKVAEIYSAVANEDADLLCTVPGIGRKGAQRLILEMRSKIKDSLEVLQDDRIDKDTLKIEREAVQALVSLGFEIKYAKEMVKEIDIKDSDKVEDIIKYALSQK